MNKTPIHKHFNKIMEIKSIHVVKKKLKRANGLYNLIFFLILLFLLNYHFDSDAGRGQDPFDIDCRTSFKDGGCPNDLACYKKCMQCYQGHGEIYHKCRADGRCICLFSKGATCPPLPNCPLNPPN